MMTNKHSGIQTKLLGMLAVLLLLATAVNATYVPTNLPQSTFWQGKYIYNQSGVDARVEYAVYDTSLGLVSGITNPGSGRFIYAYQVFNVDPTSTLDPITAFQLVGGGNPAQASGISSQSSGAGSSPIAPTVIPTTSDPAFVWQFADSVFVATKYSAFLVISTDKSPIAGSFTISTATDNGNPPPVPGGDDGKTPEPATLAILVAGAVGLMRKRKN
jgi:hypothetical protein